MSDFVMKVQMLYLLVTCWLVLLWSAVVHAQSDPDTDNTDDNNSAAATPPTLTPPKLLEFVEANYPEEKLASGTEAVVQTRITISSDGVVEEVEIIESAGEQFDSAALEAIYQFLFEPAYSGDTPIRSQVNYPYRFFFTEVSNDSDSDSDRTPLPPTGSEAPRFAELNGTIRTMEEQPIVGANVFLVFLDADETTAADTSALSFATDANGAFAGTELEPGIWQIDIVAAGYKPFSITEQLEAGQASDAIYRLETESSEYEMVIRGRKPPREVTRREITRREITRIPGTGGDAIRSVQNMPGLARASGLDGSLIVRGSSPQDSKTYFGQIPIPLLYHFGGLTSVINSDLLDHIDFYPGNYSVRYGGATGGIVDVYPKTPATDRFHGYLDADLWDVSLLAETPIGEKWSIAASGRRSYIDGILNAVMPQNGGLQFTVAPRYYDYQLVVDYHPSKRNNLNLFLFGSDDRTVLLFGDQVAGNPNFSGDIDVTAMFHQAHFTWKTKLKKGVSNELKLGLGYWKNDSSFGDNFQFSNRSYPLFIRDEFEWQQGKKFILRLGTDNELYRSRWRVITATTLPTEGEHLDPVTNSEPFTTSGSEWYILPAVYVEAEYIPIENLRLIPGIRFAYFDQIERLAVDPRLTARYKAFRHTTFKAGVGLFNQAPNTAVADDEFGTPNLELIKAMHYSLGVEQEITPQITLSTEGFYKSIHDLVVSGDNSDEEVLGSGDGPRYTNDGEGSVMGLELLLKHSPTERLFGWISYTFMKSTRIDHPGADPRPFDYDQSHILTVVASIILGRGWEAGVRFRLVTGNPETPIEGAVFDANSDIYWPMFGEENSHRLPTFHQLDVRIDKRWQFKHTNMSVYVDVQNVYNRKNPEGHTYNYDYSDRAYVYGLPVFPSLGFKLEY